MGRPIRRAGVIGAGVMGSGIAAHFANAGVEVVLLDIVPPDLKDTEKKDPSAREPLLRRRARQGLKARPAAFFHKRNARLVTVGNIEDDLGMLKDCDLVIEAVLERLDVKRALFEKLEKVRQPTRASIASNTSGLRIDEMMQGRSRLVREALPRDALLQPRPVHEAPRARGRAGDRSGRSSSACAASARTCSARASSSARTRRTSSATASARTR